jgi:prepilin-type processing-associated H-X9-DG protein
MEKRGVHFRASGFTLVKLLVIVAVIALLLAMLLPVLSRAGEKGRASSCVSNLRQIGIALAAYADESAERYPFAAGELAWDSLDPLSGSHCWMQQLTRYVGNRKTYRCPSDDISEFSYFLSARAAYIAAGNWRASTDRRGITQASAFVLAGDTFSSVASNLTTFASFDCDKDDYSQNCVGGPLNGSPWKEWRRHSGGQNILFTDGHVQWFAQYVPTLMTFRYDGLYAWP